MLRDGLTSRVTLRRPAKRPHHARASGADGSLAGSCAGAARTQNTRGARPSDRTAAEGPCWARQRARDQDQPVLVRRFQRACIRSATQRSFTPRASMASTSVAIANFEETKRDCLPPKFSILPSMHRCSRRLRSSCRRRQGRSMPYGSGSMRSSSDFRRVVRSEVLSPIVPSGFVDSSEDGHRD